MRESVKNLTKECNRKKPEAFLLELFRIFQASSPAAELDPLFARLFSKVFVETATYEVLPARSDAKRIAGASA